MNVKGFVGAGEFAWQRLSGGFLDACERRRYWRGRRLKAGGSQDWLPHRPGSIAGARIAASRKRWWR